MDGIQPYVGSPRASSPAAVALNPTLVKTPSDYLRAVRRRVWLVLAVAVPLSVGAAVLALRQPAVYRVQTQIQIEPPQYDPVLATLVPLEVGRQNNEPLDEYIPNRLALLKSRALAEQVVNSPDIVQPAAPGDDPAQELLDSLQARQVPKSKFVTVALEGADPARITKLLETLLKLFRDQALEEKARTVENSKTYAEEGLKRMSSELAKLDKAIYDKLRGSTTIGPGGRNVLEEQWQSLGNSLVQKRVRLDELKQQALITQLLPGGKDRPEFGARESMVAELERQRKQLQGYLRQYKRTIRDFNSDPAVRSKSDKLAEVLDEIERLKAAPAAPAEAPASPLETVVASMGEEIRSMEEASRALLARFQESMPEHQKFLNDQEERRQLKERIADLQKKLSEFDILAKSQKDPVQVPPSIVAPIAPIRPRRSLNIAVGLVFSFGLGIVLVCFMEYLDHTVKVPEHVSIGLSLPLYGVIPPIRRTALTHRGGHLWTPGAPESVEADAYRNLRASLLGATDRHGPVVTLLVTSAKAGEGKSTTALNLAATCARAGERTLLMDVDLRRPSLADVFPEEGHHVGLVDVLRGELPWQRTVVRTDLPLLDFLPTGDARAIPVEILGTLELRQLLIALASHYDRVILDGPAVLGLADCRMLGRVVDAALLVVRSGAHGLRPLQRAKAMLEQSHVVIAGVVINGLYEDLKNWSSYGPYEPYGGDDGYGRGHNAPAALAGHADDHAALPA